MRRTSPRGSVLEVRGGLVLAPALTLAAGVLLGACGGPSGVATASLTAGEPQASGEAARSRDLAAANRANPADPVAALDQAHALRTSGAKSEALAVLDKASSAQPSDRRLMLERGLLALELGDPAKAEGLLRQAHDPKAPDWRLHSALGAVLASRGKQQEAQAQFAKALALAPDQPSVLNNLALSYALDGKTAEAEKILRKAQRIAGKSPQVEENLALVLGLRGRFDEARTVGQSVMPPAKADQNVAYLEALDKARTAARSAQSDPDPASGDPARKASASLPAPVYQLGGPARAN